MFFESPFCLEYFVTRCDPGLFERGGLINYFQSYLFVLYWKLETQK